MLSCKTTTQGSPPRMRGKAQCMLYLHQGHGITPAHAGKSLWGCAYGDGSADHPRACGEKQKQKARLAAGLGSPPRMRGKGCWNVQIPCRKGITPAHAGKSILGAPLMLVLRDHPRACGEKPCSIDCTEASRGSPPRMRGKGKLLHAKLSALGITPAHAGKSHLHHHQTGTQGDHPRACGEKGIYADHQAERKGSPPRMRGKARQADTALRPPGITPAHAGKSSWTGSAMPSPRDHPRACGEKIFSLSSVTRRTGSPPRMRGKDCCGA